MVLGRPRCGRSKFGFLSLGGDDVAQLGCLSLGDLEDLVGPRFGRLCCLNLFTGGNRLFTHASHVGLSRGTDLCGLGPYGVELGSGFFLVLFKLNLERCSPLHGFCLEIRQSLSDLGIGPCLCRPCRLELLRRFVVHGDGRVGEFFGRQCRIAKLLLGLCHLGGSVLPLSVGLGDRQFSNPQPFLREFEGLDGIKMDLLDDFCGLGDRSLLVCLCTCDRLLGCNDLELQLGHCSIGLLPCIFEDPLCCVGEVPGRLACARHHLSCSGLSLTTNTLCLGQKDLGGMLRLPLHHCDHLMRFDECPICVVPLALRLVPELLGLFTQCVGTILSGLEFLGSLLLCRYGHRLEVLDLCFLEHDLGGASLGSRLCFVE